MNDNTIISTVPAANELHKVPGFDPMKHLHRAVNAQGEPVMGLEPRYQRLWFRLACPNGRMLLNPLRITDQLAIFEAKVYFHREDATPASSFTANKTAQETANYIRAAQDEALKEALDNAGFGIQLCDVTQAAGGSDGGHGFSAPSSQARVSEPPPPPVKAAPQPMVKEAPAASAPAEVHEAPQPAPKAQPAPQVQPAPQAQAEATPADKTPVPLAAPAAREPEPAPEKNAPAPAPQEAAIPDPGDGQKPVLELLNAPAPAEEPAFAADTDGSAAPAAAAASSQAEPGYTADTPIEEILTQMTVEDARAVVVQEGTCKGWTMGQVADQRPSSLQFFLTAFCKCGNIQKAASTLLIQQRKQKKAG